MLGVTWADHHFIVASAYYLEFNIEIITTSTTQAQPSMIIPCRLPQKETLWLGNITGLHYQSILKDESPNHHEKTNHHTAQKKTEQKEEVECPICNWKGKNLKLHMKRAKCIDELSETQLAEIEKEIQEHKKELNRDRLARYRSRMKDEDPDKLKKIDREAKSRQRKRKNELDHNDFGRADKKQRNSRNVEKSGTRKTCY